VHFYCTPTFLELSSTRYLPDFPAYS